MKTRKRFPIVSCLFLVGLLFPAYVKADRYATLTGNQPLTLADGETALVIFANRGQSTSNSGGPLGVAYTPDGGATLVIIIPSTVAYKDSLSTVTGGVGPNSENPFPLVGPATLAVSSDTFLGLRITTTEIPSTTSGGGGQPAAFVPSNSVVIPENAAGPVEIILESSIDLVTWTPANPGSYGSSTEKRFFRVRAVENAP